MLHHGLGCNHGNVACHYVHSQLVLAESSTLQHQHYALEDEPVGIVASLSSATGTAEQAWRMRNTSTRSSSVSCEALPFNRLFLFMAFFISTATLFLFAFNSLCVARKASICSSSADVPLDGAPTKLLHATSFTVRNREPASSEDEAAVAQATRAFFCEAPSADSGLPVPLSMAMYRKDELHQTQSQTAGARMFLYT